MSSPGAHMKQLRSTVEDLRALYASAVTVKHIAEPLASFDVTAAAETVRQYMQNAGFSLIGVRRDGRICGFAWRESLVGGYLGDHTRPFADGQILLESASITSAMRVLRDVQACFVKTFGQVGGIVTCGDLQKAPVRMWLFGLVTLLEMQMLRLIKLRYPADSWTQLLCEKRLVAAKGTHAELSVGERELELADCLQFCDKAEIICRASDLRTSLGFASRRACEGLLDDLKCLRDDLAHAQDILKGRWPELVELADRAEQMLQAAESIGDWWARPVCPRLAERVSRKLGSDHAEPVSERIKLPAEAAD